jgi:hypothetical protein
LLKTILVGLLLISVSGNALAAPSASSDAMTITGKRMKLVGKAAVYGFGGGLVVGLASQVFRRNTKNIFMFGSLGMYAGIILGVYVISSHRGPAPFDGPDTYEDYGDFSGLIRPETQRLTLAPEAPRLELNLMTFRF